MYFIFHQLPIEADKKSIYKAFTTQEGVSNWWVRDCVVKPEVGFINEFIFGTRFHNKMRVTGLVENKSIEWTVIDGADDWIGTTITFEIIKKDGLNFISFKHDGYRDANDFYASCNYNWGRYMMSLKLYCETGIGAPYEDEKDGREVKAVHTKKK